jgi:hypothetical protein
VLITARPSRKLKMTSSRLSGTSRSGGTTSRRRRRGNLLAGSSGDSFARRSSWGLLFAAARRSRRRGYRIRRLLLGRWRWRCRRCGTVSLRDHRLDMSPGKSLRETCVASQRSDYNPHFVSMAKRSCGFQLRILAGSLQR